MTRRVWCVVSGARPIANKPRVAPCKAPPADAGVWGFGVIDVELSALTPRWTVEETARFIERDRVRNLIYIKRTQKLALIYTLAGGAELM